MHKNTIPVKQNNASNLILKNINNLKNAQEDAFGDKKLKTSKGDLIINSNLADSKMKKKLQYTNIPKLFLYLCYRMCIDHSSDLKLEINEILTLKGQKRDYNNIQTLKDDLEVLSKIKIQNFKANIKGKETNLEDGFLFKVENIEAIESKHTKVIPVIAGSWAEQMRTNDQCAYIPKEIFKFNKLKFDIAFNILQRFRNQSEHMKEQHSDSFVLSIKYILDQVNLNVKKHGSAKVIKQIEEILDDLSARNWFIWKYKNKKISDLPFRDKIAEYKKFMVRFTIGDSILGKANNLAA